MLPLRPLLLQSYKAGSAAAAMPATALLHGAGCRLHQLGLPPHQHWVVQLGCALCYVVLLHTLYNVLCFLLYLCLCLCLPLHLCVSVGLRLGSAVPGGGSRGPVGVAVPMIAW